MLGFGEEPIPEADFNNALKYVQKAYKLRGERLESLEERSDEGGRRGGIGVAGSRKKGRRGRD